MSEPAVTKYSNILTVPNMRVPLQGPQAAAVTLDFAVSTIFNLDLRAAFESGVFDYTQNVYIDNSANASTFTLLCLGTGQDGFSIVAQPQSQGIYPVSIPVGDSRFVATSAGAVEVPVVFYNCPMPIGTWGANTSAPPPRGAFINRSSAVVLGGTSQTLMAADATRTRFIIENPVTAVGQGIAAAESLYINFTSAAGVNDGTSFEVSPGGSFDSGAGPVSTEKITVNAATTNHRYIAKEMLS